MQLRPETEQDPPAIFALHAAAFETDDEARLVERLRVHAKPLISWVAEDGDQAVGHILFSPVTVEGYSSRLFMGLAPMAVLPGRQRQGIGSQLVRQGLAACRELDQHAVVVLGHRDYYPRFGFRPASKFGLRSEYDVPDEAFMAMELEPGSLSSVQGVVRYHSAFGDL